MCKYVDRESLEELTNTYLPSIFNYCLSKVNNRGAAEEITQEVFLTFTKKYKSLKNDKIYRWLKGTADNKILEFYKAQAKLKLYDNELHDNHMISFEETINNYDLEYHYQDISKYQEYIYNALESEADKMLFEDFYINKIGYENISKKLNISENAVKMRVVRLKEKAKQILKKYFEDQTF